MAEQIGFIGGGNMAFAIGGGFISKGLSAPTNIWVSGPHIENLDRWNKLGANITTDNGRIMTECSIIFLAVKPHLLESAIQECWKSYARSGRFRSKLIVSVVAGVTLPMLKQMLRPFDDPRIVRTMPNVSLLVGDGVVLYCCDPDLTGNDCQWIENNLGRLGLCEKVTEDMMDSLGTVSGCGPAYMFLVCESLISGAVARGVRRDVARRVASHMLRGAGSMLCHPEMLNRHPAELRDEVTSPGGSTAAGLAVLERSAVRSAFTQAIDASAEKNALLGKKYQ